MEGRAAGSVEGHYRGVDLRQFCFRVECTFRGFQAHPRAQAPRISEIIIGTAVHEDLTTTDGAGLSREAPRGSRHSRGPVAPWAAAAAPRRARDMAMAWVVNLPLSARVVPSIDLRNSTVERRLRATAPLGGQHNAVRAQEGHILNSLKGVFAHIFRAMMPSSSPPSCNACHPPAGVEHFATGCGRHAQEAWAHSGRRVVVHVATCQEGLRWLKCSWHANMTIRVVHKCTREHPGYLRDPTTNRLQPQPWRNLTRPRAPCIVHLDSAHPSAARESEAHLSEIAATYGEIRDDDMHVFIQGGKDESRRYNMPMAGVMPRLAARRDLAFASLSGAVYPAFKDVGVHHKCDNHIVREGIRLGALRWLRCNGKRRFAGSYRGAFAVSGRRIRQTPHATWIAYHQTMVESFTARGIDSQGEHTRSLEMVWPLLFGCCSTLGYRTNESIRVGFECYERAPAVRR